ncbi:hypothetical protein LEMLEM_LOCUS16099 [Lemmus lemmus]
MNGWVHQPARFSEGECHLPVTVHMKGSPEEKFSSLPACPLDALETSSIGFGAYLPGCCFSLVNLGLRFLIPM